MVPRAAEFGVREAQVKWMWCPAASWCNPRVRFSGQMQTLAPARCILATWLSVGSEDRAPFLLSAACLPHPRPLAGTHPPGSICRSCPALLPSERLCLSGPQEDSMGWQFVTTDLPAAKMGPFLAGCFLELSMLVSAVPSFISSAGLLLFLGLNGSPVTWGRVNC